MTDPYDGLFVEEQEPKEEIANTIKKFIKFSKNGEIIYGDSYSSLNGKQKVLLHILISKVLAARNLKEQEGFKVQEINKMTGISIKSIEGYVYGQLKMYVQSDAGRVFIPNYRIKEVIKTLGTKGDNDANK